MYQFSFQNHTKDHEILLTLSEKKEDIYKATLEINTPEVKGSFKKSSIFESDLQLFSNQLNDFNKKRTGKLELRSVSPNEMLLTIQNLDNTGRIEINIEYNSYSYYKFHESGLWWNKLSWGFELDPSCINDALLYLRE